MASLPTLLPTPPEAVRARLFRQALPIRSLWFPSRAEVQAWNDSGCPIYARGLASDRVECGPRLGAMWASVFSPVFELHLTPEGPGTRLSSRRRFPAMTVAVLGVWAVLVGLWGAALAAGFEPNGAPWWALVALSTVGAPLVGWFRGGRALDAGVPWLNEVLLAPDDEEDW